VLERLGSFARAWVSQPTEYLSIAVGRTLLALAGLGTLVFTSLGDLIRPAAGHSGLFCDGVASISLWCVTSQDQHWVAKVIAILVLLVAATGFAPRYLAIPMWWVLYSNQVSFTTIDGGDQIAAVFALLIIPIGLADRRMNHWLKPPGVQVGFSPLVVRWSLFLVQLQVCYIYLNACLTKLSSLEWVDGTALYYWFRHPMFGPAEPISNLTDWLTLEPVTLAAITWGTLVLEFLLGVSVFLTSRFRTPLLIAGLLLHLGIAMLMGLWSFAFAMWAGLILAFRPERELDAIRRIVATRWLKPAIRSAKASELEDAPTTS
jgi:antimicrobial peptide system SdpB family protein